MHSGLSAGSLRYLITFFFNYSIELLEKMFDGRAFHSLAVVGKQLFPNVLDKCPV